MPQVIRSSRRDAPAQTRLGNVSARILKRNQFATSARYLVASSVTNYRTLHEPYHASCILSRRTDIGNLAEINALNAIVVILIIV